MTKINVAYRIITLLLPKLQKIQTNQGRCEIHEAPCFDTIRFHCGRDYQELHRKKCNSYINRWFILSAL